MNRLAVFAVLAFAGMATAGEPDYFPLEVGNQWVLQTAASVPEVLNIEVLRSRVQNGQTYFLISGYSPEDRWVRMGDDGTLYALNQKSGQDEILARFAAGAAPYSTLLGGCEQEARPSPKISGYGGPNFEFGNALMLEYSAQQCRDVGITQEIYAAGTGLVRRVISTIRGEIAYDLVYARVNGSPVIGKSKEIVLPYDFNRGSKGWLAGFSDYSLKTGDLRMLAELRTLPDEISQRRSAFYIQSMNRSDDIFMFLKKHVSSDDGLEPNQAYRVWFDIRFASNAPTGCSGVGGSPGDSVYLKAGASADEPLGLLTGAGDVQVSVDKGQQATGGSEAGVVGTIGNGRECTGSAWPYVSVRKDYAHPEPVRTDERGWLWLLVGTDSAFEGLTGLYVESITVRLNPSVDLPVSEPAPKPAA